MKCVETEVNPAIDIVQTIPTHCDAEKRQAPAEENVSRSGIKRKITRCTIAALLGIVIVLSCQIYGYRQILHSLQRTVDLQNTLLNIAMGTEKPTDLSAGF